MKYLIIALFAFSSCRDLYPSEFDHYDASQVEGIWRGDLHPHWTYHFSNGLLHQSIFDMNVPFLVEQFWAYKTRRDTLFLMDIENPAQKRVLLLYFENDSTAEMTDASNAVNIAKFKIRRY